MAFLIMLYTVVIKNGGQDTSALGTGQFGTWGKTVQHLGPNSL